MFRFCLLSLNNTIGSPSSALSCEEIWSIIFQWTQSTISLSSEVSDPHIGFCISADIQEAGASGCALASRLAQSSSKPTVLLLEAGEPNGIETYMQAKERFAVAFDPTSFPNWGYKTVPQNQLAGQEVDYSRGRGLGGTTSINFCGWIVGPKDDYDEWARLVGDDDFKWTNAKRCLDKIQRLHPEVPLPGMSKYINPNPDHSTTGLIDLSYGGPWIQDVKNIFTAAEEVGMRINPDLNAGDPIGLGMGTVNCYNGKRISAASAYLPQCSANLKILTGGHAARIVLQNKKAVAVETTDGRIFRARKEIILSGGALNSPQLLLLSGIGPRGELEKHDLPVINEMPLVGRNLKDHCYSAVGIVVKHSAEFEEPSTPILCPSPMAFLKSPTAMASQEFKQLTPELQRHLSAPTVSNFEIATVSLPSHL